MNVLFLSISELPFIGEHSISLDLIHEFQRNGHSVYVVCALGNEEEKPTICSDEAGCKVVRVKIGKNKKANIIEKGITTVMLPIYYKKAIASFFSDVHFELVLYPTPPITQVETVKYIKKKDGAITYLLLKDIFPQNAVDLGMMTKSGVKGLLHRYFRNIEKKLYAISDYIGCMSQANVDYVITHNPEVNPEKVEICPNSVEVFDKSVDERTRIEIRNTYGIPLDKRIFVYGGNLGKPQGIDFMIECLKSQKNNNDVYFLVVGDGTEYGKIENYVNIEKPENVKIMKRLPKEDYDKMVAACDVGMIFLDHRFTIPNFPSRLLSYMQAKIPVLAVTDPNTDIGKVIADGGFGWWSPSNSVVMFSQMVKSIVKSDCSNKGKAGFEYLDKYYSTKCAYEMIVAHLRER